MKLELELEFELKLDEEVEIVVLLELGLEHGRIRALDGDTVDDNGGLMDAT